MCRDGEKCWRLVLGVTFSKKSLGWRAEQRYSGPVVLHGLAVPTGGHSPMTGDMFGCHAGAGVLLAPHGQRLEMLLNIL